MARPPKYKTDEERQAARRLQIRKNVRAFRERHLEKNPTPDAAALTTEALSSSSSKTVSQSAPAFPITSYAKPRNRENRVIPDEKEKTVEPIHTTAFESSDIARFFTPSPLSTDVVKHSASSPIDLSFGYFESIAREGEAWVKGYPFWGSAQLFKDDILVTTSCLSASTAGFGILLKDAGLARQSREAYQTALQYMRRKVERLGTVKNDAEGMGMIYANYSLTSVEFCENAWNGFEGNVAPWITHLRAGFTMMESAGPYAFRDKMGLKTLRVLRSRLVLVAILDERPCFLNDEAWRTIPYEIRGRTMEDVMWNLSEMVPTHLYASRLLMDQGARANEGEVQATHKEFRTLHNRFIKWFAEFVNHHEMPTHFNADSVQYIFEPYKVVYGFLDLHTADILVSYWFHLFVLTNRALEFHTKFATHLSESISFLEDNVAEVARHICRSTEWIHFCEGRGFERLVRAYAPLRLVFEWYWLQPKKYAVELQWCWAVLENMAVREPQGELAKHFIVSFLGEPRKPEVEEDKAKQARLDD